MIKKAMVVNDDSLLTKIVCRMIEKAAFASETVTANDGEKALAYFEEFVRQGKEHFSGVPEFIFLDLNMAVMNGWDFLEIFSKKYAALFPTIKVAVLSASVDEEELLHLKRYRVVSDIISTPISLDKLRLVKQRLLAGHCVEMFSQADARLVN
ncbi:MAG: response regulator [Sediminibacterium sp.]|nr:response regulator [Sediminibacterium sp.]